MMREYIAKSPDPCIGVSDDAADQSSQIDLYQFRQGSRSPDWRWLLGRDDSPWYPTARLFRQNESRTWEGVIASAREALRLAIT
jgi:hypothetical protein